MAGTFEIYKDKAGEFRFRLNSSNGQTVLTSEGYKTKASARNGASSVEKNCQTETRFEKTRTPAGNYRFALKSSNGQVVGTSQNYKSASGRNNGVAAVARAAIGATVKDLT